MPLASSALLAPHFTAHELRADDPTADARIVANLRTTAAWLETARGIIGAPLRVTSGYRDKEHNARVGGSPTSDHVNGLSADFVPLGVTQFRAWQLLRAAADAGRLPAWDQLLFYPVEGHIHVGLGAQLRREVKIKTLEGNFVTLTGALAERLRGFARTVGSSPLLLFLLAVGFLFLLGGTHGRT